MGMASWELGTSRGGTMRRVLGRVVCSWRPLGAAGLLASGSAALAATPQSPGPEPGSPEQMEYFADHLPPRDCSARAAHRRRRERHDSPGRARSSPATWSTST